MADRVVLLVDLTHYHDHLVRGATGAVVGDVPSGRYFSPAKRVRFDCCGDTRDIIQNSMWVGTFPPPPPIAKLIKDP